MAASGLSFIPYRVCTSRTFNTFTIETSKNKEEEEEERGEIKEEGGKDKGEVSKHSLQIYNRIRFILHSI